MRYVTKTEMIEILKNLGNSAIVGCTLETKTVPTMTGKDKPKDVYKITSAKITLNSIYENKVNRQLTKEGSENAGNFETAGDPAWKERITRILSRHRTETEKVYLDYMPENVVNIAYVRGEANNLTPIEKSSLSRWMKEKGDEGARQGTDKPVVFRHVALDNVISLSIKGELYVMANTPAKV